MVTRVISFSVIVPVLSTHRTVICPSISIAGLLLTITPALAIRQAPSPRKIVKTIGNSSGRRAIAAAIPASEPTSQSPLVRAYTTLTVTAVAIATIATTCTIESTSRCKTVRFSTPTSHFPSCPSWLARPTALTFPTA